MKPSKDAYMPVSLAVAKIIRREIAADRGRTQKQVLDDAGLSKSTFVHYDKGDTPFPLTVLAALCAALKVKMADVIRQAEEDNPQAFELKKVVTNVTRGRPSPGRKSQPPKHHEKRSH
jgi:transcriptional regulator with XRE-family HTH domain